MSEFRPRPRQEEVLNYRGGKMGVSAVPGAGKTQTLSYLAAQLAASGRLEDDQEVLIVTLVNSAVDNFARRVAEFVQQRGLLPHFGYRVRTLHGLAHDIVRERPALVGLSDDFQIVDERAADQIRQDAVEARLSSNPQAVDAFVGPDLAQGKLEWVRRDARQWPRLVSDIARSFIKQAKDLQMAPEQVSDGLDRFRWPLPLLEMCCSIYADYQRALAYRGAVDFDDLIRLALQALKLDEEFLERLRHRWPFVLEDEAQDSSLLQERILRLLIGKNGNWVRVGDPNQAIYETFTTASPGFLRNFLKEEGVEARALPNSGRSTQSIVMLANYLIDWSRRDHPVQEIRDRDPLMPPHIEPSPPGDPQPNPPDDPTKVRLVARKFTPREELQVVVDSLASWLPAHRDETVAVLVPRNDRGFAVASELKERGLEYVELLRSTSTTREAAGALGNVVRYLANPTSPAKLATVYKVWRREDRDDDEAGLLLERVVSALRKCRQVEDFLWPRVDRDWLGGLEVELSEIRAHLDEFRVLVRRWQGATLLPIDQLILTLAQDLFHEPADLAVAHSLAVVLRRASEAHPDRRLPELAEELAVVARNERRFMGFSDDDLGFDPERHKGKIVVATVHRAKGLEWDRVYLMSVNNYDFPSAQPHDQYIAERWFVRDHLNLEAEALAQLEALSEDAPAAYEEGEPTRTARHDYAAERLRLLYVGITRAKKELIITWNTGRHGDQQPAAPFIALHTFWEGQAHAPTE